MKWTKNNSECEFVFVDVKFINLFKMPLREGMNSSLPILSNCKQFFHKDGIIQHGRRGSGQSCTSFSRYQNPSGNSNIMVLL